jgi:peptidoglycan/LPS O-acetylase OafA/YrhL
MGFELASSPRIAPPLRNVAVRTGVYSGVGLSVVFAAWIFIANQVPALDPFLEERNLTAVILLGGIALVPVLRFLLAPAKLWISSLIAWTIFSVIYAIFSAYFNGLREHFGAFQVFVLGAVLYMLVAAVSWVGNIIWRTRASRAVHDGHSAG